MNNQAEKFNTLAERARKGCQHSRDLIYSSFIPIIVSEAEKIWYKVEDSTSFEFECYQRIKGWIKDFDVAIHNNFYSLVLHSIHRLKKKHLNERGCQRSNIVSFESLAGLESDKQPQYPDDRVNLAEDVIENLEIKKRVTELSQGDPKKMTVLNAWIDGYNDSEASEILANLFGGASLIVNQYPDSKRNADRSFQQLLNFLMTEELALLLSSPLV